MLRRFDERRGLDLQVRLGAYVAGDEGLAEARRRQRVRAGDAGADRGYRTCCNRLRNSPGDSYPVSRSACTSWPLASRKTIVGTPTIA